jgi:ubiquinone/menaquinone biosynthesis C-methylase UbiE
MLRVPEPELMDEPAQAHAYAEADFSESNSMFVDLFREKFAGQGIAGRVLDLGCGPADIPIRLAREIPDCEIDAVDGAESMLHLARQAVTASGFASRINLIQCFLPDERLATAGYGAVISNSLLHHLGDPGDLWSTAARCGAPGAAVLVMDLLRPGDEATVDALVDAYAADAPEVLRHDFRCSLFAAYTLDEIAGQLQSTGLGHLELRQISDRHWAAGGRLGA